MNGCLRSTTFLLHYIGAPEHDHGVDIHDGVACYHEPRVKHQGVGGCVAETEEVMTTYAGCPIISETSGTFRWFSGYEFEVHRRNIAICQ